jgi:hypothetical protein
MICGETDTIEIRQGNPASIELTLEDISVDPAVPIDLTGKTVFISVKKLNDFRLDDTEALISSSIVAHTDPTAGETTWDLTASETLIPLGRYKADVRVYKDLTDFDNSVTFYIEIVPVVTRRLV